MPIRTSGSPWATCAVLLSKNAKRVKRSRTRRSQSGLRCIPGAAGPGQRYLERPQEVSEVSTHAGFAEHVGGAPRGYGKQRPLILQRADALRGPRTSTYHPDASAEPSNDPEGKEEVGSLQGGANRTFRSLARPPTGDS